MKKSFLIIMSIVSFLTVGHAQAELVNVAPSGVVTASGTYLDQTPDKAVDEDFLTQWNSGDYPPQWIEIDLGDAIQIKEIRASITQVPDGDTHHDVYLDGVLSFSWDGFTVNQEVLTHAFDTPVTAQVLRLETTSSPSWVGWREVQIMSDLHGPMPVPLPFTVIMLTICSVVCVVAFRLKRKASRVAA
jgi:hypothetical protein